MQTEQKFKLQHGFYKDDLQPVVTIQNYVRRFSTAIDIALCEDWVERFAEMLQAEFESVYEFPVTIKAPSLDTITEIMITVLAPSCPPHESQSVVKTAITRATEAINMQIEWINSRVLAECRMTPHCPSFPLNIMSYCEYLFDQGFRIDDKMLRLQQQVAKDPSVDSEDVIITVGAITVYPFGRFIVVHHDAAFYLLPAYIISLIVAKSIELGACLLSITQSRRSDIKLHTSRVVRFLQWMQGVLREYGNKGHSLLKALDGIGHGILSADLDESHSSYLLTNITQDLVTSGFSRSCVEQVVTILRSFPLFDIPNITGLAKIYGYPTIETQKGVEKLYKRTHEDISISDDAVRRVVNMAKLLFLAHFWRRHKTYPTLIISERVIRPLARALLSGKSFMNAEYTAQYGRVKPGDFDEVEITPCVPFDWFDRFYPLLKDKAAAPRRSLIDRALTTDDMSLPGSKRVLLSYIRCQNLSQEWRTFRKKFSRNPKLVKEEFVIKLTSKEKEQKTEGRMFGQSPIYERQRRIVGESNIAYLMEMYNSDQAMLINEHEKRRKMAFLSRAAEYAKDAYTIIIGVDAEAWNNYFRAKLVNEFGRDFLDKIFGVSFYEHTMSVFNLGLIYHRDSADNVLYWEGQEGGIEGLAQKVWTWIYTVIARLVLYLTELEGCMMVNGDDMRIILIVPKSKVNHSEEELQRFQQNLLERLRSLFRIYGIVMKVDETNMTRSLLCFGRNYVINGIALPGDIKKIIKAGGLTDVGFPSITDVIASITSNAHSACGLSYQVTPHVCFAYTMILLYLHWHRFISLTPTTKSSRPVLKPVDATILLTLPNCMGGLDTLTLYQFVIQGESDSLPLCLDWFMFLWHNYPEYRPPIKRALSVPIDSVPPRGLLITDVYALPLKRPPRPNSLVQRKVRKYLYRATRNTELKRLLLYDQSERHKLINSLWSLEPFNPRVASYLYSLSPCALVDSIVQKFDSAQTLASIVFRNDRKRQCKLFAMVIEHDRRLIGTTVRRILQGSEAYTDTLLWALPLIERRVCATTMSTMLRMHTWRKREMVDATIPSVLQQMVIAEEGQVDPSLQTFDNASPHVDHFAAITRKLKNSMVSYGPLCPLISSPYFAHTTGLQLRDRLVDLKGNEPMIAMLKKLTDAQALLSDLGTDVTEWADWCGICLYGEPVGIVCPSLPKKISGTVGHRLPAWSFERTVYLNTLPSRTGRAKVNLDTVGRKGGLFSKNRTHNYSAMTCWFQYHCSSDLENDLLSNGRDLLLWGILVSCRDINGDPSVCTCHAEVLNREYSIRPPPQGMTARLARLINSCELTKMSDECMTEIQHYRKSFQDKWFGAFQYDMWLAEDLNEDKYNLASQTASLIICTELEPSVVLQSGQGSIDESLIFNDVLGRSTSKLSCSMKDFSVINMDHFVQALIQTCLGYLVEAAVPPPNKTLAAWSRIILPPGMFFGLCQTLYIGKAYGRFISSLNNTLGALGIPGIQVSYDLLISPQLLSRSLSRIFAQLSRSYFSGELPAPTSHLIYLPGLETDAKVKSTYLAYVWRILIIAVIRGLPKTGILPPSKVASLYHLAHEQRVRYLAVCFLMTQAYRVSGFVLCEGYVRTVTITPHCWLDGLPGCIITWDPLQEYIAIESIPEHEFSEIVTCADKIIQNSILKDHDIDLVITRLPYKVCIMTCNEWVQEHHPVTQEPQEIKEDIVIIPPPNSITCSAIPLDSDQDLENLLPQRFPFNPVPKSERHYWNPACLSRYYHLSTSALNKFLECLLTVQNLSRLRKQRFLLLGTADGAGGVSTLLTRIFSNSRVYFNTLQTDPQARVSLVDCPDSAFLKLDELSRIVFQHNASGSNDLCDLATILRFKMMADTEGTKYWCITCDAEAPNLETSATDHNLTNNLIRLFNTSLADGGMAIVKRFISPAKHQVAFFMYVISAFARVSIFKPHSSHKSSGEIFFVCYNKTREWTRDKLESFINQPTGTYETVSLYLRRMEELNTLRDQSLPGGEILTVGSVDVPTVYQVLLRDWRITRQSILSATHGYIPLTWFSSNGRLVARKDQIETTRNQLLALYPESFIQFSSFIKKSAMMALGCATVCYSISEQQSFRELDRLRRETEDSLQAGGGAIEPPVLAMHIRHFRVGGRLTLGLLGAAIKGILSNESVFDEDDMA